MNKEFVNIFGMDESGEAAPVEKPIEDKDLSSRAKHLKWCKERAVAILDAGSIDGAYTSMMSDLGKSTETIDHVGIHLGTMLLFGGHLGTDHAMRKFITDFN